LAGRQTYDKKKLIKHTRRVDLRWSSDEVSTIWISHKILDYTGIAPNMLSLVKNSNLLLSALRISSQHSSELPPW
jgi:hypothetical protein